MERNKFMFFSNFKIIADKLNDDMRLKFYDALTNYVFKNEKPEDLIISALLEAIKPSLDRGDGKIKNWGGKRDGAGRPKKNQDGNQDGNQVVENRFQDGNQDENQEIKKAEISGEKIKSKIKINQDNQVLSRTETETETETKRDYIEKNQVFDFVPPTEKEVLEYAEQMDKIVGMGGFECCPEQAMLFFAYYDKSGWLDKGGVPVVDWKKSFKYWVRRDDMRRYQKEQKC